MFKKGFFVKGLAALAGVFFLLASPVLADPPAPVTKTWQTGCWDSSHNPTDCSNTIGQDGNYQKGVGWNLSRFTDHGDGTVTDNLTGLMWTKDAYLLGGKSWANAITACENLELGHQGCVKYTDWRLPNAKELQSLIDLRNYDPAIPSGRPSPFTNVQSTWYWTSTTYAYSPSMAWNVDMFDGALEGSDKTAGFYVWCVRDGPN